MQDQKTLEFLQKLKDSGHWNHNYDYSKVNYINNITKVTVIDNKTGLSHNMIPANLLKGSKLTIINCSEPTNYFIKKSIEKHGNKYIYNNSTYIDAKTEIEIFCKKEHHGIFKQQPQVHLRGSGCPICCNKIVIKASSLMITNPDIAAQWHNDKNGNLTSDKVVSGSSKKVWWICDKNHEWEAVISSRIKNGCPICAGNKKIPSIVFEKRIKEKFPNLEIKNLENYKGLNSKLNVFCTIHKESFTLRGNSLYHGQIGCGKCNSTKKDNSIIINEFKTIHGDNYGYSKMNYISTHQKVIIECFEEGHGFFEQSPASHKSGAGCPKCAKNINLSLEQVLVDFKSVHGDVYDYSEVIKEYKNTHTSVTIICKEHGPFKQAPSRHKNGQKCPECAKIEAGLKGRLTNEEFKKRVYEIYDDKCDLSNTQYETSIKNVKIRYVECGHDVEQLPHSILRGMGCPICNNGFTKKYKLQLINQLHMSDLLTMDPVELSIIIQQGKLPIDFRLLVNTGAESDERIATLRELQERYESEEDVSETSTEESINNDVTAIEPELVENDEVDAEITNVPSPIEREPRLPLVNQIQDLHSLDNSIYAGMDEEAFQTLVQYKLRKIWNSMLNKEVDIDKLKGDTGGKYFTMIKEEFLSEYESVLLVEPSIGYNFRDRSGNIAQPNLMQKLTVYRLLKNKYYGNWSGTGAGKTLSFILASRNMDARLTLVIALNSTIEQTCKSIKSVYPDNKCFTEYQEDYVFDRNNHNYLVLNYEKFQQDKSEALFQSLTNNNQIDFIVIDEVHNAKQREEDNESARRIVMTRLLGRARENKNLHVLAMSATPVINNLFEAKSLLQLMSGLEYEDLQTRRTIGNALSIFQQLTLNGLRFIPKYDINISELTGRNMSNLNIDGSHLLDALLKLTTNDYIGVEKLILADKLQAITSYLRKGTIIYSYFTTGIINKIQKHVESLGFKVGTYTGEESTQLRAQNLKDFISGKIDILIGSRPIGTGVDGLQDVCNRMICITLPWTDSEYTQLKGRIYRQGSEFDGVEIIIPQVRIELEDELWSWDIQRLNLIKNKKTLADAAVDGVIPSNAIPTPETMLRRSIESLKNWQDRVSSGNVISSNRRSLQINLYPEVDDEQERLRRINSELSEFNRRGKTTRSETMHKEFTDNPDSWHRYHTLRKSRMESWEEIPYEYIATKINDSRDVVADFGCGENLFRKCIPNNKVYAFDHIAIDETVIACDMKNTGLDSESIDVAVFSLALWGTNSKDYIKEAYRVLRRKGMIYIAEPAKDYGTSEEQQVLIDMIKEQGFQQVGVIENRGKFIYLIGIKI